MSDEYVQRYQPVSHEQLYQGVQAGDAEQIDTLATAWSSMKDTVDGLGRALREDLDALDRTWSGDAGDEFQRRVGLVVQYSTKLASGMGSVHEGLSLMSGPLRTAQRQAESPEETDDHDKTIGGAAKGALFGPGGAVIGAIAGHLQDQEEKEKAHQRMVKVVAELAASYDLSTFDRWTPPPPPPVDTPGGVDETSYNPRSGPGATTPTSAPDTGSPAHTGTSRADGVRPVGHADFEGGGLSRDPDPDLDAPTDPGAGTSLAGAGPSLGSGALLAGWAAGAGGMVASTAGGTRTSGAGGGPSWGSSTVVPAGGVLGAGALAAGAGGAGSSPVARPAGGGTGLESRAAVGGGRAGAGRPGAAGALRPGVLGGAPMSGGDDDEPGTRSTWLTEDDMDWRGGAEATPAVLGPDDN
ncbi:WXG100 family type VII secretion target [Micromonospora sagamiensis]|uniref:WXG100 family type VII secretion target n=1 Tax=Micromonospora sagamiensis TaxID=47875 RepID=A0A562WME6_9ACTN|nr:WXG100 family type VII secretion target [Micromonospora sagamiensis]TWJ31241.1 hypothetical protein JD81_04796 [Micromonospora sagamiensis]BCL15714.1 hypothetical protein GCM10017556_34530 [Micromonospora sagamiensis]